MIDNADVKCRAQSCLVEFKGLTFGDFQRAIYIENEYDPRVNRYLRWNRRYLQKHVFHTYKGGYTDLYYLPHEVKKLKQRKQLLYRCPFLSQDQLKQTHSIGTEFFLQYLADPDDARFLKPGFLFYRGSKPNGITVYEYYPLFTNVPVKIKKLIKEILKAHHEKIDHYRHEESFIHGGDRYGQGLFMTYEPTDENLADRKFHEHDVKISSLLVKLEKNVQELKQYGVPMTVLEEIIHQDDIISRLVITKDHRIFLPEYHNMEIKMEPLVKAVFFLFLKHREGIIFKYLPDYREELMSIYKELRPLGLSKKTIQSIEDVTNPCLNSINEKCARIHAAFTKEFDDHLAQNYYITGKRGMEKKISLPRDMVVWE
ncbi:MAG: hypothetical protein IJK87_13920 [Prevotella sp.]|nr:hypothetical protein [Prevotella sp.]